MKSALAVLFFAVMLSGCASQESHTGHHGGARLGAVSFPVSCNAAAQQEFNTAMAYYHSFAWAQIREPLERALKADPSCGMVHWLRALASLDNPFIWPSNLAPSLLDHADRIVRKIR